MTDPVTGKTGSLLRNAGYDPLWMETNTSTEYWQKGASLLVTDPLGTRDVELPPNARAYLIAGTQHGATAWMTSTLGSCVNPRNRTARHRHCARCWWRSTNGRAKARRHPRRATPRLKDGNFTTPDALKFPGDTGRAGRAPRSEIGVLKDWIKPEMDMSKPCARS